MKALLIDLDDTLYDEGAYVLSGFRAVVAEIGRRFPQADTAALFTTILGELQAHGRGKVFDRALAAAGLDPTPGLIRELVGCYRTHPPDIALFPGVAEALADLRRDHRLAIVTDGLGAMQRRKVAALGVEPMVDEVLYCWEHESPKPHPGPYAEALKRLGASPQEAVVIGDNPAHDMAAAKALGCRAIRVLTGRFAAEGGAADAVVQSFTEIPALLRGRFGAAA
jgi:putative hydrolase of the HAD superfamily